MILNKYKFTYIMFYLFTAFCIINGIKHPIIHAIGQYGKILIAIISIIIFLFILNKIKEEIKVYKEHLLLILFFSLFILFSFSLFLNNKDIGSLTYSILFGAYLLFIYFITTVIVNKSEYNFYLLFQKIILVVSIIAFILAFALNLSMHGEELAGRVGFGGFYSARMAFGLLSAVGFIITFFLYQSNKKQKDFLLLFMFLCFVFLSESRTPQIIIIIFLLHYYLPKKIKTFILIFIMPIIVYYVIFSIDSNTINTISSGRLFIWDIAYKEILNNGIFNGFGIYNLNDLILTKYKYASNFFEKSDEISLHSSFLSIIASGGIISLFIFLYINYIIYKNSTNIYQSIQLSILIGSLFESYILSPNMPISLLYWSTLFIQINIIRKYNKNDKENLF